MENKEMVPVNDLDQMVADINAASKGISFKGLNNKQKKFCLAYAGDKVAALEAAGYVRRSKAQAYQLVNILMQNTRIRLNIEVIDKMLARYCIASAVEIKLQLSERLRSADITDGNRAAFSKLMLQTHGDLIDPVLEIGAFLNLDDQAGEVSAGVGARGSGHHEFEQPGARLVDDVRTSVGARCGVVGMQEEDLPGKVGHAVLSS